MPDAPLPPATRVFASGTHPKLKHWWYVTAFVEQTMLRGYVEDFRVNVDLPEPMAELRQLHGNETPEGLAKEKFRGAVQDGHDLRYYENVLLYVNRGRAGIGGTYQDPNVLGRGSDNIKLYAGHRIWLVSPEYAKALESVVPSGSLTGGAVAKARRFAGHFQDILQSVTESRHHFDEVAGEFAQAIRDHLPAIVGITAGFLTLEAGSMFLAVTPTGVGQAAAAVIQLALAAFGAAGMVEAGIEALKHGSAWLTTAWTAHGKPELIAEASKEFLRMLVAVAVAALSYAGAKANYGNALKIANNMPTGGLPAFATGGARANGSAGAGAGVAIGPSVGGPAAVGAAATRLSDKEKAALGDGPDVDRLGERDVGEARSSERRDRRAAESRERPAPETTGKSGGSEAVPTSETRTELAKHIPPPGHAFAEWFDSLSLSELDRLLADRSVKGGPRGARDVIEDCIRHPGDQHEWLMVAEARQFKKWGVSMRTIQESRTLTVAAIGKSFRHGGTGSGAMHRALRAMIRSSGSSSAEPLMTSPTLTPWTELLSKRWSNVRDEYGPNSQAVASAFMTLDKTRWLEEVGRWWQERAISDVTIVRSWDEALAIFAEDVRYNANGVLEAPCARVDAVLERYPERKAWWQKAREKAKRYTAFSAWLPDALPQEQQDLLYENLWEYVSILLVEIIVSPEAECTYFREQLPWFHAGHFPCGWEGDWPRGRMRVF